MVRSKKKNRDAGEAVPIHIGKARSVAVHTVKKETADQPALHKIEVLPHDAPKTISWRAAEFHYIEKDYLWYAGVVAAGIVLFIVALWQRNFFFAVFVAIASALVVEFGKRKPRTLDYELTEKGFSIDKKPYADYKELLSFHVRKRLGFLDEIVFRRNSKISPFIHLPIDDKLAVKAHDFLLQYLPEEEHQESLVEIIAERIGF